MSIIVTLALVQQYITRYVLSTIVAMGNLGNLIIICVFAQKKYRKNSCSIYFLFAAIFGFIASNWAIPPLLYALDHVSMVNISLILCRIRGYSIHVSSMCYRFTLVFMCIDRYALTHSRVSIRSICRPQIAYRAILILVLIFLIISIHILIFESIENGRCFVYGIYGQFYSFYSLVLTGIAPTSLVTSFGLLMMKNLREVRLRVQPFNNTRRFNRRDINLIKVVFVGAIVNASCTVGYPIVIIYTSVTNSIVLNKSNERIAIESFFNFIFMSLLLYLSYNTTFYVYIFTSKTYRKEIKQSFLRLIRRPTRIEQTQNVHLRMENQIQT